MGQRTEINLKIITQRIARGIEIKEEVDEETMKTNLFNHYSDCLSPINLFIGLK